MTNNTNNTQIENVGFSIHDILRILYFFKWNIIFITLSCGLINFYISISTIEKYTAFTDVLIDDKTKTESLFQISNNNSTDIVNEIQILKSRQLAEAVIEELWSSNYRNRMFLFGTKTFYPKGQRARQLAKKIFSLGLWEYTPKPIVEYDTDFTPEIGRKFAGKLRKNLSVKNKSGTKIIRITYSSPHPNESARIANSIARVYKKLDQEWESNESEGLLSFLNRQIDLKSSELREAEIQLQDFKKENKIFKLDNYSQELLNQIIDIERELNNTIVLININQKKYDVTNNTLSKEEQSLAKSLTSSLNTTLFALQNEIGEYESELIKNISIYGDEHEAVSIIQKKIRDLKEKLNTQTNNLISQGLLVSDPIKYRQQLIAELITIGTEQQLLNAKKNEYRELLEKYNNKLSKLPRKQMDFAILDREFQALKQTYTFMRTKLEEAKISSATVGGKVRIIDTAIAPSSPIGPNIKRDTLIGLLFGLFLSGCLIYLREFFDKSVKTIEYLDRFNIPLLTVIPAIGKSYKDRKSKRNRIKRFKLPSPTKNLETIQRRLITHENPKSPVSEAYRSLRTNLLYSKTNTIDEDKLTIMISSPGPGEGKTTTILNLAITFANLGKRTVIIDSDLRKPVLHKVFDVDKEKGLTHYLCVNGTTIDDISKQTEVENLDVITCGAIPPNPSELLASKEMGKLIEDLKSKYDVILFDAPPIMAVTDAVLMSKYISQFIMVVRVGVTEKGGLLSAVSLMGNVGSKISGFVLNALDYNNSYYYSSYYSYQNYYYYSEDK